jgi:hypothetical protein
MFININKLMNIKLINKLLSACLKKLKNRDLVKLSLTI